MKRIILPGIFFFSIALQAGDPPTARGMVIRDIAPTVICALLIVHGVLGLVQFDNYLTAYEKPAAQYWAATQTTLDNQVEIDRQSGGNRWRSLRPLQRKGF